MLDGGGKKFDLCDVDCAKNGRFENGMRVANAREKGGKHLIFATPGKRENEHVADALLSLSLFVLLPPFCNVQKFRAHVKVSYRSMAWGP